NLNAGDPYWHGYNFLPYTPDKACCTQYTVLASQQNFLDVLDQLANSHGLNQVFFFDQSYLFWYYQLATSRITITQLNDLISQLATTQAKIADTYNDPYIAYQPPIHTESRYFWRCNTHTRRFKYLRNISLQASCCTDSYYHP